MDEGFSDVKLKYLGFMWVIFEFDKVDTKVNMMQHIGVKSWLHVIQDAVHDFVSDERIVWVDIEGIPLNVWSRETFMRNGGETREVSSSLSHPPGFTPEEINRESVDPNVVKEGGSVLGVLEDMIRVVQAMGEAVGNSGGRWNGETIILGDFNEVLSIDERRGSCFNPSNARVFDHFISSSGLVDIKLEGYAFTWSHPSGSKMSKLDRFLVSGGIFLIFPSITALCLDHHLSDHRPILLREGCNSSFVALTLKVADAKFVNDFRPISLIGSMYKLVTKILANRLALVIADIVSDTQSAFAANKQILDGPFILNEILHWCKRKKKAMFFKVDFAKAYDSVRWDYLLDDLEAFSNFFNEIDSTVKKITWAVWDKILAFKENGGLGVSSFHALNRALLLKWVWRFISQDGLLWFRVIQALYGPPIVSHPVSLSSNWCSIVRELHLLTDKELNKEVLVADKMKAGVGHSFRRHVRAGFEHQQIVDLNSLLESMSLSQSHDRWFCDLTGDGEFRVKESWFSSIRLPSKVKNMLEGGLLEGIHGLFSERRVTCGYPWPGLGGNHKDFGMNRERLRLSAWCLSD
nr:RNA-directed DNA polymerase, eukaryota [Tanacetum cinerariifolium]